MKAYYKNIAKNGLDEIILLNDKLFQKVDASEVYNKDGQQCSDLAGMTVTAMNYFDGHNYRSLVIDDGDIWADMAVSPLDENDEAEIIQAYETAQWIDGPNPFTKISKCGRWEKNMFSSDPAIASYTPQPTIYYSAPTIQRHLFSITGNATKDELIEALSKAAADGSLDSLGTQWHVQSEKELDYMGVDDAPVIRGSHCPVIVYEDRKLTESEAQIKVEQQGWVWGIDPKGDAVFSPLEILLPPGTRPLGFFVTVDMETDDDFIDLTQLHQPQEGMCFSYLGSPKKIVFTFCQ